MGFVWMAVAVVVAVSGGGHFVGRQDLWADRCEDRKTLFPSPLLVNVLFAWSRISGRHCQPSYQAKRSAIILFAVKSKCDFTKTKRRLGYWWRKPMEKYLKTQNLVNLIGLPNKFFVGHPPCTRAVFCQWQMTSQSLAKIFWEMDNQLLFFMKKYMESLNKTQYFELWFG